MRDLLDRNQANALVEEICSLDGIAGLDGGKFGEIAILFPGNKVRGLHVTTPKDKKDTERLEVYVIVDGEKQPSIEKLAFAVRKAASAYTDAPIDVIIADVK